MEREPAEKKKVCGHSYPEMGTTVKIDKKVYSVSKWYNRGRIMLTPEGGKK